MKRIALVIPTMTSGGAEQVMSQLANQWANQGLEVHLILLAKADKFYRIEKSVTIHQLGFENTGGKVKKVHSELTTFFQLRKLLKKLSPNTVLSFMTKYNAFTLIASLGLGLRVFVSVRSNPYKKLPFTITVLRKYFYRFASGIIAQTEEAKSVLKKETNHKNIEVIPNPVREVKLFPDMQRENIIINVGRMVPEKAQKFLLEAFAKIQNDDWKLVLLGDGPLRKDLEKQTQKLNISNKVIMPGVVDNVDEWLAKSSIFVLSSVSEGFPNALLEAMAAGLPCISFNCPVGPPDIIENGKNGFLVDIYDIENLQEKMEYLIENRNFRNKIIENINLDKHSLDNISNQYLKAIIN